LRLVISAIEEHLNGSDYTLLIFTGHGFINTTDYQRYIEVANGDISILKLKSDSPRQTIILDACSGYYELGTPFTKTFSDLSESLSTVGFAFSRKIYDDAIMSAERGIISLFSSSGGEGSDDSVDGGIYL
jgi:hypothetical protein